MAARVLLLGLVLDLGIIALRVVRYPQFLAQRDSRLYLIEPVAALLVYAAVATAVTTGRHPYDRTRALRTGTLFGVVTGALWIVNLAVETFADFTGGATIVTSAPFLLGGFALWGVAAGVAARRTSALGSGVLAAVWAAVICASMTVTFGLALALTSLPRLEHLVSAGPDYLRSGWQDLRAFAIANQFDAAASHLAAAPVIAAFLGLFGGAVGAAGGQPVRSRAS